MSDESTKDRRLDETYEFLAKVLGAHAEDLESAAMQPDIPADLPEGVTPRMSGVISLRNQPEFWADAPWRIEPDQDAIPLSFHVRDADIQPPAKGPWRLDMLRVEKRLVEGTWRKLCTLLPADLPDVDDQGISLRRFWVFGTQIPVTDLQPLGRGNTVHLRVLFVGSFFPYDEASTIEVHLESYLAEHALPLGRAAHRSGARHWFYGDPHYHSAYTNDIKEFGGAVAEARRAGQGIGLDWLVITDHSCDLDEIDPGSGGRTRWERLRAELGAPGVSDQRFRCIQGEEVTLYGRGDRIVHMLAIGSMDRLVEGSFLPSDGGGFQSDLARKALENILSVSKGYPADVTRQLFGRIQPLGTVLEHLSEDTLTFAAHPYDVAQIPPAKWDPDDLAHPRLTGHEFWNGRSRSSAGATFNPFDRAAWTNLDRLAKSDRGRILKLKRQARDLWDPHLQAGVVDWQANKDLPSTRPVFIGGSDGHGDFNYHVGWAWDYREFNVNDNALGRVRTVVYLPEHAADGVPETDEIVAALKKGACVVTDGPVIEWSIAHGGQLATLGDVLSVSGSGDLEIRITPHTTPEFGPVQQVDLVAYFAGQRRQRPHRVTIDAGRPRVVRLDGHQGYIRAECQTTGRGGESFCCFTNPIWVRAADHRKMRIHVSFA